HPHPQGGTHPLARALGLDGTAVELDEVADDREAEAQAAERPRARRVGLPEAFEEVGEELGRDAPARVANGQLEVGVHALQPDVDAPALGRELDRVGDEVPHRLLQPFRISPDQLDPRIGVSGVRSSWDTVARNSSFKRLVSWASRYSRAYSIPSPIRSATIWSSCASCRSNCRGWSVPTWRTPITLPSKRIGTPRSERTPFCRRIGFSTLAWAA